MAKLSQLLNLLIIGNPANAAIAARMKNVDINPLNGTVTFTTAGADVALVNSAGTGLLGQIKATKIWNAVWNDYADFQLLDDRLEFGKCYVDTKSGAKVATTRCQLGVIGIASDTFGMAVGQGHTQKTEVPIAVCGWVLAYVDKEYPTGTPLTNDTHGNLTEMTLQEKRDFPERIVAIYKKPEPAAEFGDDVAKIKVNGRHWVMVK